MSIKVQMWHWGESLSSQNFLLSETKTISQKLLCYSCLISLRPVLSVSCFDYCWTNNHSIISGTHNNTHLLLSRQPGQLFYGSLLLMRAGLPRAYLLMAEAPEGQALAWNWHILPSAVFQVQNQCGRKGYFSQGGHGEGMNICWKVM